MAKVRKLDLRSRRSWAGWTSRLWRDKSRWKRGEPTIVRLIRQGGTLPNMLRESALGGTNKFANFFVVEIPVVFSRKFFLDKELYLHNHPPKPRKETKEERAARFQRLMDENG